MKRPQSYLFLLMTIFLFGGCKKQLLPSLQETFERADKSPFGSFAAFQTMEATFGERIHLSQSRLDQISPQAYKGKTLYIIVAGNLALNSDNVNEFQRFLDDGNDLFISADFIDPRFLNEINCSAMRIAEILAQSRGTMRETTVSLAGADADIPPKFGYYYYPFLNYFPHYDKRRSEVLGYNEAGLPNFIRYNNRGGNVYIHLAPRAFGNYFLLTADNHRYLQGILHVISLNKKQIYWDEYYKRGKHLDRSKPEADPSFSTLRVVKQEPALLWAFWLVVAAILLFMLTRIRRKQRLIPEVAPPQNATLEFTETIGALYLQNKDNKNIAEKKIAYLYENISSRYFVGGSTNQEDIFKAWAKKNGASDEQVKNLLQSIRDVRQKESLTDEELLSFSRLLESVG